MKSRMVWRGPQVVLCRYAPDLHRSRRRSAALALDQVENKWGTHYPMSIQSWRTHWDAVTTFFKYPMELRRIVYTTNAIESLNAQIAKEHCQPHRNSRCARF